MIDFKRFIKCLRNIQCSLHSYILPILSKRDLFENLVKTKVKRLREHECMRIMILRWDRDKIYAKEIREFRTTCDRNRRNVYNIQRV